MHEVFENTVRFEETDAQGIVFYGNYVTYQDETLTSFMEAVGFPYGDLRGWDVHVVHVELDYRRPAAFRDRLVNAMRVAAVRETSIEFEYECRRAADGDDPVDDEDDRDGGREASETGAVLAEGTVVHVVVDDETGDPIRVPDEFREAVVEFQDEPPEPV